MKTFFSSFSKNLFLCAATLAIGILGDVLAHAQPAVEAWVQAYNGLAESDDRAQKLTVDSSGNVFVVGFSDDGVSGSDWLLLKYSNMGVLLWTNRFTWPRKNIDRANTVTVDPNDDAIVTGYSYDNEDDHLDCLTIKYSGAGLPLWTNRYNGGPPHYDWGKRATLTHAAAADGRGNVFVAVNSVTFAYSSAGVTLWTNRYPGTVSTGLALDGNGNVIVTGYEGGGEDYHDFVTIKFSGAGVPLWTNRYIACGYGYGYGVAADVGDHVFVTGSSCGDYVTIAYSSVGLPLWTNYYSGSWNGDEFAAHSIAVDTSGNVVVTANPATLAYSNAGVPLWTNRYHGPEDGRGYPTAMRLDASGNVFVTGNLYNTNGWPGYDYATIKYSSTGRALWTNHYNGSGDSQSTALAVDGTNVFVTGYSWSNSSYDYATIKYSSAGETLWTSQYNRLRDIGTDDQARAIAVDGSGNVFVTGSSSAISVSDYLTFAYSGAGVLMWTNRYSGPGNSIDFATALAADNNGNVIVTGKSSLSDRDPFNSFDYATIKYSRAGLPLWTNRYNGPGNGNDEATAVAADASGNVFVTGHSVGTGGGQAFATIKYSDSGVPLWTNRYSGPAKSGDFANAMVVDSSGNLVVTGESYNNNNGYAYATIKYSSAGLPLWTNRYNGPANNSFANAVGVDAAGNVFVTGNSSGSTFYDYATIKYSSTGVPLWTNRYDGLSKKDDAAVALAVDRAGNVFVTGSSGPAYATIKYSSAGTPLWTNLYNGQENGFSGATAIAVDSVGNVVVTGGSSGTNGDSDYATIKYSGAGMPLWTNRYNGFVGGDDRAYAVAVDGSGNVFVTGESWNGSNFDYLTVKYSEAGVPLLTIARAPTKEVVLSWPSVPAAFSLQQNTNGIGTVNWNTLAATPADDGKTKTVILNPLAENAFYRLIQPSSPRIFLRDGSPGKNEN